MSRDLLILVEQSTEPVAPSKPVVALVVGWGSGRRGGAMLET
jgi:hypothetical protein